jgi:hypothetical protein
MAGFSESGTEIEGKAEKHNVGVVQPRYPHCSASAASKHEKFSPRSTADMALEIYYSSSPVRGYLSGDCGDRGIAEAFCVGPRWCTEGTHIFAAELRGRCIPNVESCCGCILTFHDEEPAGFL